MLFVQKNATTDKIGGRGSRLARSLSPGGGARNRHPQPNALSASRGAAASRMGGGQGFTLRVLAIGDSAISGVGVARGDETVSATTARALARLTGRPVAWRAIGLSGATTSRAMQRLVPRLASEPADLIIVAFGVNDVIAYRSPSAFADALTALVTTARARVGDAAVVIAGVAPLALFPGLPWPLRTILGWRCAALQASAERLTERLPRIVVERFCAAFSPDLFAGDGFHPNARAHELWGEDIAALALPLLACATRGTHADPGRRDAGTHDRPGKRE